MQAVQSPGEADRSPLPEDSAGAAEAAPRERIWQIVALIPAGRVATYGQIAALAGMPRHARLVGRTLRELPAASTLPWHRVVNATLRISLRSGSGQTLQRQRLEAEGVEFIGERVAAAHRWSARAYHRIGAHRWIRVSGCGGAGGGSLNGATQCSSTMPGKASRAHR